MDIYLFVKLFGRCTTLWCMKIEPHKSLIAIVYSILQVLRKENTIVGASQTNQYLVCMILGSVCTDILR
jgi:hypothetical protein